MTSNHIPDNYLDLVDGPYWAALTTLMPDGRPQVTPVWCSREGDTILINIMRGFRKEKNMRANPAVTLLIYDPRNPERHIEIRGTVVEMTEEGALEHLDALTRLYMDNPNAHFFGDSVPEAHQASQTPIRVRIAPVRVRVEG